jgi:hypothetical protein
MTLHFVDVEEGLTQAERVKALDKFSELECATVITSSMPSKYSAFPIFPAVHWGPLIKVPVLPLPEESEAVIPFPSSNFQWATRLGSLTAAFANQALASELGSKLLLKAFALTSVLSDSGNLPVYGRDDWVGDWPSVV